MPNDAFRNFIALGCVLGGSLIHYTGNIEFVLGVVIWLILAATAGYMLPRGWMVITGPIPWIVGVGGGLLTGQHETLGELWPLSLFMSTLAGVVGVIFGAAARRGGGRSGDQSGR